MSSTPPVLIRLQPEKYIEFPLSLYNTLKTKLVLHNISSPPSAVSFKIKTTAPKCYLVRPSTGAVPPGSSQEVEIVLQPLTAEPPASAQDRFLVQAISVQDVHQVLPRDYWATVDKSLLHEQRLTVAFRKPDEAEGGHHHHVAATEAVSTSQFNTAVESTAAGNAMEYKTKYEEVVKYCLSLEKKNNMLSKEADELKKQVARASAEKLEGAGGTAAAAAAGGSKFFGLEFWHWFLILMLGIILMKLTGKL
eukprot:GHVS01075760.1.p1 GENE.GHVS01075760.1~~GHVS01075760.1.p1  ORF type:complete len:264 (-),score=80.96 GHVS01075760.1:457-1206(-)